MKIALAHDSLTQMGGAEKVLEDLHQLFPDAPVYVLAQDKKFANKYKNWDIRTSGLQSFYNLHPKLQHWLFLIPWAVGTLDFTGYDLVISSSSGFVKNIHVPKNTIHINYCHTPTRFLWVNSEYVNQEVPILLRWLVKPFLSWLKNWDYKGAQRVTNFIANSAEVQRRIKEYYHRDSEVVYPGVETDFWHPTIEKKDYFLIVGRLQAHKRNDLIVEIFNELGLPLHIVGTGRQENYLKSIAKPNIRFLGRIPDDQLRAEYSSALGLIFPQIEDFGLVPVEAAACCTATLGIAKGGTLETVAAGQTGELFGAYDKEKIKNLILTWDYKKYAVDVLRGHAEKFSQGKFKQNILRQIDNISSRP